MFILVTVTCCHVKLTLCQEIELGSIFQFQAFETPSAYAW